MASKREDWVRVKDRSELTAAMAIQFRPCRRCGRTDTMFIKELGRADGNIFARGLGIVDMTDAEIGPMALVVPECREGDKVIPGVRWQEGLALGPAIREGRLFRLVDNETIEDVVTREKETVER